MLYIVLGIIGVVVLAAWYFFFAPHTTFTADDLAEQLAPGHKKRMALYHREQAEKDAQRDEALERENKKWRLEQELRDAKWILDYERRLTDLENQIAKESCRATTGRSKPRASSQAQPTSRSSPRQP